MKIHTYKLSYSNNKFSIKKHNTEQVGKISFDRIFKMYFECERCDYYFLENELQPLFTPFCRSHYHFFSIKDVDKKHIARFILANRAPKNKAKISLLKNALLDN